MGEMMTMKPRLRRYEASHYLLERYGISRTVTTLATLAPRGGGRPSSGTAGSLFYPVEALGAYAASALTPRVHSTSAL